jgi:peptidyl-tRNA hydrolase
MTTKNGLKSIILHLVKHTQRMDIGVEIKKDISESLNVSTTTYYRWLNNTSQPDWREMQVILHILQKHDNTISMDQLAPSIYLETV